LNRFITALALLAIALGAKHIVGYAIARRQRREQREALQTWEGEGGAVPVTPGRTAAQVMPHPERSGISDAARG
jgi:hypothetical protein